MKFAHPKPAEELRMSSIDFDKIMRQALQVAHEDIPKVKKVTKAKPVEKERVPK